MPKMLWSTCFFSANFPLGFNTTLGRPVIDREWTGA